MDYNSLKTNIKNIEDTLRRLEEALRAYPRNSMGMVLDSAKDSSYVRLKEKYQLNFNALRTLNHIKVTRFKKEYAQERKIKLETRLK